MTSKAVIKIQYLGKEFEANITKKQWVVYLRELQEEIASQDLQRFLGLCDTICDDVCEGVPAAILLHSVINRTCDVARCVFITRAFRTIPSLTKFYKGNGNDHDSRITSRVEWLESLKELAEEV